MAELRTVVDDEFTGAMSVEWERHWHPSLPPLEDALASMSQHGWW
jgi:hypothetical protein